MADKPLTKMTPVVFHFRRNVQGKLLPKKDETGQLSARGGATVIVDPTLKVMSIAACCYRDNFCKRAGYSIAQQRLKHGALKYIRSLCDVALTMDSVRQQAFDFADKWAEKQFTRNRIDPLKR